MLLDLFVKKELTESSNTELLTKVNSEIEVLEKEIGELANSRTLEFKQALDADEEYQALKKEYEDLTERVSWIYDQFTHSYRTGRWGDDWDFEEDPVERKKWEPELKTLNPKVHDLRMKLDSIVDRVQKEVNDRFPIDPKKDELKGKKNLQVQTLASIKEEEKENLDTIIKKLEEGTEYFFDIGDLHIENEFVYADLKTSITQEAEDDDFDWDDEDFEFCKGEDWADEFAGEVQANLKDFVEEEGYEKSSYKTNGWNWYITGVDGWEICDETEGDFKGEPYISNYSYSRPTFDDPGGTDYDVEDPDVEVICTVTLRKKI